MQVTVQNKDYRLTAANVRPICAGREQFFTRKHAELEMIRAFLEDREHVAVEACRTCGCYHLKPMKGG